MSFRIAIALTMMLAAIAPAAAQLDGNFDEAKVPSYVLPDPLETSDGAAVKSVQQWEGERRPELLGLFRDTIYGAAPPPPHDMRFVVTDRDDRALGGLAIRKQVTILLDGTERGPQTSVLIYLPARAKGPAPVFVGLNFHGNQAVAADPAIAIATSWVAAPGEGIVKHHATARSRGIESAQWPLRQILEAGYGVATYFPGDLYPDGDGMVAQSVQPHYGTSPSDPSHWGAIATWAWGLSRVYDYLATDAAVDASRVIVIGHSRYGKAALWAGARDPRFAMVVSNDSGNGGAALYRRRFGETIRVMNDYWFAPRFKTYARHEDALPIDAHELIALIAPRPVYVASATGDLWSDPKGEFLAARGADPVYHLYGMKGLEADAMPAPDRSVGRRIGYHIRAGKHDITAEDWAKYIAFADRELAR
ncbi:alpha/beta hydrolase [Stakelama saccharophila]|uniref:4-O-methyl-glucuronoyl methylesterase-like domain-containing protein n=1 Tax=Stakelama saccharophila TaxID=3075605 RepID=A0ABZ0B517_9SPHN|nr:hypothetical protein [Stakelama sp. W311]WNO52383.1 hypothetical protein RPR59_07790 [Stakelama sp. W311]